MSTDGDAATEAWIPVYETILRLSSEWLDPDDPRREVQPDHWSATTVPVFLAAMMGHLDREMHGPLRDDPHALMVRVLEESRYFLDPDMRARLEASRRLVD